MEWLKVLKHNPLPLLIKTNNSALLYFVRRDLLDENVQPISNIWNTDEVNKIVNKQQYEGSWKSKKRKIETSQNYDLIETWKQIRFLIDKYEMNTDHMCIQASAKYIFSCQTAEGDIRGFLGNQYASYYTGAMLGLLIKAGFTNDNHIDKGLKWLLSVRQNDGGWIGSPIYKLPLNKQIVAITKEEKTIRDWDRTKPLCLNSTGMILRAFSNHPIYRKSEEAIKAAILLKKHFFMENNYSTYKHKDHWLFFQFPYWWNNLIAALDSISKIIPWKNDEDIQKAINWVLQHQEDNGLWKMSYSSIHKNTITKKTYDMQLWITYVILKILKRLIGCSY